MKAIVYDNYGPADVLKLETLDTPAPGSGELLIEVHATSVTTADWRFRAAEFGPGMQLLGRLFAGLFRPRHRLTGREFCGRVVATGAGVTRFAVGDEVLGAQPKGVNAEYVVVGESASVVHKPRGLTAAEAVALPFGAITSATFLRDMVQVQPGERVLIVGASGGVGVYAVQLAKHLGAEVTGVCSTKNAALVRSLGADHVVDYTRQDPREVEGTWDVVLDCVGKTTFADYRSKLSPKGRHAFVQATPREIWQSIWTRFRQGPKVTFGIAVDSRDAYEDLVQLVDEGAVAPVIGHHLPMREVVQAHRIVESRHRSGAVVLHWPAASNAGAVVALQRAG